MYNVFSSGASHGIYAQFMEQSTQANKGRPITLLCGSGTRMGLWFYAMHRVLRLKKALLATIFQPKFTELKHTARCAQAVSDIENPSFWKAIYHILRAVFPCLRALRCCDKSEPCMDQIVFLAWRATKAIEKSIDSLNDKTLFEIDCNKHDEVTFEKAQFFSGGHDAVNANTGEVYVDR